MRYTRLWLGLATVILGSFAVLGYFGRDIYRQMPPIPDRVVTTDGRVLFTGQDIHDGQNVWQSMGGQEVGSVWGHGAYVAPDWSADWLHREATWLLNHWAQDERKKPFSEVDDEHAAGLKARLKDEIRKNTYDPRTGDLVVSKDRAAAIEAVGRHYVALFGDDPALKDLRDAYAIPANSIRGTGRRAQLNAFFFWTAWVCGTDRPGSVITYTNNWPSEELIDNHPTGAIVVWSVVSFVALLAGVGGLAWYFAAQRHKGEESHTLPEEDPLLALRPTPSMKATLKYWLM